MLDTWAGIGLLLTWFHVYVLYNMIFYKAYISAGRLDVYLKFVLEQERTAWCIIHFLA